MRAELPSRPLSSGVPDNVIDVDRSGGITLSGVLSGVDATASNLLNMLGKYYSTTSKIEDAKFQRTVQTATLDLARARALGSLEIDRAAVDAQVAIEKARAARATGDAMARINSGGAGYFMRAGVSPLILIAGAVGLFMMMRRGRA